MRAIANYIDGELHPAVSGQVFENFDPAIGRPYSTVPESGEADVSAAVAAAQAALPAWRGLDDAGRARWLERLAQAIEDRAEDLARAESIDNGKPLALARTVDIPRASANLRFFAHAATQFASESHAMGDRAINYTLRRPIGVVGCISPWNLPLYLFTWKIAPALAAGNCVIGKPSEVTPMTAFLLTELCAEIGFPRGVLNVLHGTGPGVGQPIVAHPAIKAISFTGGTKTGASIAAIAGPMFKKLSLELGGKNPSLVFADCDLDRAVHTVARAAFSNQGQICLCGSRILVERSIYDRFRTAFVAAARRLRVGDPLVDGTDIGAMVSKPHFDKVLACIRTARDEGGRILCGGEPVVPDGERCRDGWFLAPTVIDGLDGSCRTNQEEIFGPVATLLPFDDESHAIEIANGVRYGLAAVVFSSDVSRCHRVAGRLEAGLVWVNDWMVRDLRTPMGGFKDSGVGREGGFEAMRFFTEAKNVCITVHPERGDPPARGRTLG